MKDEFNDYNVSNPDGVSASTDSERKISFNNDLPHAIREDSSKSVSEWDASVPEQANFVQNKGAKRRLEQNARTTDSINGDLTSATSSLSSSAAVTHAATTTTTASVAATMAGGGGAIVGVLATTVVATVVVVATFISMLTIKVSLVMADMYSLVFQVEMQGAQEEDFQTPIYAILEGDGERYEQEVKIDSVYLTYKELTPGKEYLLRVVGENGDKVFFEQSFCTASEPLRTGNLSVRRENDTVYVTVYDVSISSAEFYTITVKNDKNKVIFAADDVAPNKEFTFQVGDFDALYFSLSVDGKIYAVAQMEREESPAYDYAQASWSWTDEQATMIVPETHGGDPLRLTAAVSKETSPATCETAGSVRWVATVNENGQIYSNERMQTISAFGHEYGAALFEWTPYYEEDPAGAEDGTPLGYTVKAKFVCVHNAEHVVVKDAEVSRDSVAATCERDAYANYTASVTFNSVEYNDEKTDVYTGSALNHEYGEPIFEWREVVDDSCEEITEIDYAATVTFICLRDGSHKVIMDAEIVREMVEPSCVTDGNVHFTASVVLNDQPYQAEKDMVLSALGHSWGDPAFEWTAALEGGYTAKLISVCARHSEHVLEETAEVTSELHDPTCEEDGYIEYTATAEWQGTPVEDTFIDPNSLTAMGHDYTGVDPTWDWTWTEGSGYTVTATFLCRNNCGYEMVLDAEVLEEGDNPELLCTEGGRVTYYASVTTIDNYYEDFREEDAQPLGHAFGSPYFEWAEVDGVYTAKAYFICARSYEHTVILDADVTAFAQSNSTIYTASVSYLGVEYHGTKEIFYNLNFEKVPQVGESFKLGDSMDITATTYFEDDEEAGTRTFTSESIVLASNGTSGTEQPVWYVYVVSGDLQRLDLSGSPSPSSSWTLATDSAMEVIGVTIVSGSGSEADPFRLTPLLGITVFFYADGGTPSSTQYFTEQEVLDGAYALPPNEDPTKGDYLFGGWYADDDCMQPFDFTQAITESTTVYARWIQVG